VLAKPNQNGVVSVEPAILARGLKWALDHRVAVICVALPSYSPDAQVQEQIRQARLHGVVVVAAAGNRGELTAGNPTPYPAALPDVIAVSAIGPDGQGWAASGHGNFVTVAAPGVGVVTLQRGAGQTTVDDTGVAAGFVAGSVALLLSRERQLDPAAVVQRVIATATPAPLGPRSTVYGYGVVNPYRMVTERLSIGRPDQLPPLRPDALSQAERDRTQAWADSTRLALWLAGAVAVLVLVVLAVGAALPRGRRRRWRAGLAPVPVQRNEPAEPPPPVPLFDDRRQ
jgi:hypothetical protein